MREIWKTLNNLEESETIEEEISIDKIEAIYNEYAEAMEILKDR